MKAAARAEGGRERKDVQTDPCRLRLQGSLTRSCYSVYIPVYLPIWYFPVWRGIPLGFKGTAERLCRADFDSKRKRAGGKLNSLLNARLNAGSDS